MGTAFRSRVPVNTEHGHYLGWRYNFDATPHSIKPFCPHAPGAAKCEQWKPCQDSKGADFYMWLAGHFSGDRCDLASPEVGGDGFWCHHKPLSTETGKTTVCAVKVGATADPNSQRCVTVDVKP